MISTALPLLLRAPELLLGRDPVTRGRVLRLSGQFSLVAAACALLSLGAAAGLIPVWAAVLVSGYSMMILGAVYLLIRAGWTESWSDAQVASLQIMAAISAVVLSYGTVDLARGAALQILCLLLALEMDRLPPAVLMRQSLVTVALLVLTSLCAALLLPVAPSVDEEIYNLVMAAVLLPVAIVVSGELSRLRDQLALQRQQLGGALDRLRELAQRDGLTGLANRRYMQQLLVEESSDPTRSPEGFAVALIDIDWFKRINDSHGHAVGDVVLRQVASLARTALARDQSLARWGGEEFLLLVPGGTAEDAAQAVARLRDAVAVHPWNQLARGLQVSFSAGIAASAPGEAVGELLIRADRALYRAKDAGRNQSWTDRCVTQPVERRAARPVPGRCVDAGGSAAPTASWAVRPPESAWGPEPPAAARTRVDATLKQRLTDLLFSRNPAIQDAVRLPLVACGLHLIWISVVVLYAAPYEQIPSWAAWVSGAYEVACLLGFYLLIRSGWSARCKDPSLFLPHILAAIVVVTFGYMVAPALRASLLHMLCVVQLFGMATLAPREIRVVSFCSVLVMALISAALTIGGDADAAAESLKLALAAFIVGRMGFQALRYSEMRETARAQKREIEDAVAQAKELVARDSLTGLFNRRHMEALLIREFSAFSSSRQPFCVALIDLDHFKRINDDFGHDIGDRVLQGLADSAHSVLRTSDVICRWGGEEFLVLMRDPAAAQDALSVMQRLRDSVGKRLTDVLPAALEVRFSAGLAHARVGETPEQLLERADRALYEAKSGGRNRDVFDHHDRTKR